MLCFTVIILATEYDLALEALTVAGTLGMNDGRFVFILFELDPFRAWKKTASPSTWFVEKFGNHSATLSSTTRQVFQSSLLLSIQPNTSAGYHEFINDLKNKTRESPFYSDVFQSNPKAEVTSFKFVMI